MATPASDYNSKAIGDFKVVIITPNGQRHDVTLAVAGVSITESISRFHYSGVMSLFDTAELRETLPIVGQETVEVSFTKEQNEYSTVMNIVSIESIVNERKITQLQLYLASPQELINTTSIFSRAFSGRASNILDTIHKEFFGAALDEKDGSQNSINYIVPYLTPYEAISTILDKSHDLEFNPMFLFQTLADNKVKLKSLSSIKQQDPLYTYSDSPVTVATGKQPGYRGLLDETNFNRIISYSVKAFDMHTNIRYGVYGSFTTNYDLTSKTYNTYKFKYKTDKAEDYVDPAFQVGSKAIADIATSRHMVQRKNKLGVESLANVNSFTTEAQAKKLSLYNDMFSIALEAEINSRPGIMAGSVLKIQLDKDKPKLSGADLEESQISGNFIVHTLTHHLSNESYSMNVTLVKDRIK